MADERNLAEESAKKNYSYSQRQSSSKQASGPSRTSDRLRAPLKEGFTYMYSFNGKIFIQSNGSPIVLSVVDDVSTIRMIPWYTNGVTKTEKTRIDLNKIMN